MRDLLREFDGGIKVVKEWIQEDSGHSSEHFVVTSDDVDIKSYRSRERAFDRAISMVHRQTRKS